jgi:hypothetical protein
MADRKFRASLTWRVAMREVLQPAESGPDAPVARIADFIVSDWLLAVRAAGSDGLSAFAPFSAMGGAVRLHVARVHRDRQRKAALGHQGIKYAAPELLV